MAEQPNSHSSTHAERSGNDPARRRLWWQFVFGMLWIAVWAGLVSLATQTPFWIVMPALLGLALVGGAIALFWMARWAERDAPGGQFGIASLFLLIVYIATFLSCVRWSLVATRQARLQRFPTAELTADLEPTLFEFSMASLFGLGMLYISLPLLLGLLDSVMWSAVWLLKRPWFKAVALRVLRRPTRD
jgi:hypothetical protein